MEGPFSISGGPNWALHYDFSPVGVPYTAFSLFSQYGALYNGTHLLLEGHS